MVHMLSAARRAVVIYAALLATSHTYALPQQTRSCAKTHPLVGSILQFSTRSEAVQVSGAFLVSDDCTAFVDGFNVTGFSGPFAVFGSKANVPASIRLFVSNQLAIFGDTQRLVLNTGLTWDSADSLVLFSGSTFIASASLAAPIPSSTTTTTTTTTTRPATTAPVIFTTAPSPTPAPDRILSNPQTILVQVGPNPNYPNKPTPLNVSFYLNYRETPVLNLTRGVTYTFVITGGITHPFYLTSSIIGGKGANPNSTETVFLGGARTFGDSSSPLSLTFTPDSSHPALFYYQCWNHQRMGWQVRLVDGSASNTTNGTVDSIPNVGPPPLIVSGASAAAVTSGAFALIMVVLVSALLF